VLAKFCSGFLDGTPPAVFGDGEQSRDFTYVDNAVAANLLACEAPNVSGKVFNIGTGVRVTLNETIALLAKLTGSALETKFEPPRDGDIRDSQADISRAQEFLNTNLRFPSKQVFNVRSTGTATRRQKLSPNKRAKPRRLRPLDSLLLIPTYGSAVFP